MIVFAVINAYATSSFGREAGKVCGYCHIDTGGGGPLTAAGDYYINTLGPNGLAATAVSSSQINLTWTDRTTDETEFTVERSATATGTFTVIATLGANSTSYNNTGLSESTTYFYKVRAANSIGVTRYTTAVSATTTAAPPATPAAPTGLAASTASSSQINLTWTDNSSDETGFIVERSASSGGTYASIATLGSNVTTYNNTGLNASTTYYYRVYATNSAGNSANSNTASAATSAPPVTIPAAPTGLAASAASSSQINLTWTDNSSDETGFIVERSASSGGTFTSIATLGSNVTTYSNTGLSASTTYYYRVCATNSAGNSDYSNTASAATSAPPVTIPAAPTSLAASTASSSQINLTWTDNSSNETGFIVERAASSGGTFAQIATLGSNVTSYSNTGLSASTTYYYRVCASNSAGNSTYSNTASAATSAPPATIPADPSDLSATAALSTEIDLTWIDNSTDESSFIIERSASSGGTFTQIATVGSNVTNYTNTGLTASTAYYYRVCASNSAGKSGYTNIAWDTTSAPPATQPTAPTGLAASATSSSQIDLTWTDNSSNETGFIVERSTSSGGTYTSIATLGLNVTTYSNTGLSASTTYYYRVCATNSAGNSTYSNTASAATPAPPVTKPTAPTGLSASAVSTSQINLTWTDTSSNETGFIVERSASSGGTYASIATLGSNVTTYSNTGLSASTTYYYRVCATNSAGNSAYSNTASAATLDLPSVIPAAPAGLSAVSASSSQINLTWTDNSSDETGFTVQRAATADGVFATIAALGSNATSYRNTGLSASTTYYYRVCAVNSAGNSEYSNTASATTSADTTSESKAPSAPSELRAKAVSSGQINLTWKDTSSNETGFIIERSMSSGRSRTYTVIATLGSDITSYSNTGLHESRKYNYRVRAFNAIGKSGYSNTASARTLKKRGSDDDDDDDHDHDDHDNDGRSKDSQSRIGGRR